MVDSNFIAAVAILTVIIAFIGAIQLTFQGQVQQAIEEIGVNVENSNRNFNATNRNFNATIQAEQDINRLLIGVNNTLSDLIQQQAPPSATEERQIQAEQDHFNQTETILDSIRESANETRQQAEEIGNQTR